MSLRQGYVLVTSNVRELKIVAMGDTIMGIEMRSSGKFILNDVDSSVKNIGLALHRFFAFC